MKRLLLLRHAKAVPSEAADHDRSLTPQGKADSAAAGRAILAHGWRPDVAIVSDARRTRQTFDALGLGDATALRLDPSIYDGSPSAILASIGLTDSTARTVLVVGHNPGIAATARQLASAGQAGDLERLRGSFPTAALAVLRLEATAWSAIAGPGGLLEALLWAASPRPDA